MAKIVLVGLEPTASTQISRALVNEKHEISEKIENIPAYDVLDADIIFAGGDHKKYLPLLRSVRKARPDLPFVVVTRVPETSEWLDALEAGATDYCAAPFETRQLRWLMESALPKPRTMAA